MDGDEVLHDRATAQGAGITARRELPLGGLSLTVRESGGAPASGLLHATVFSAELCELLEADIGATWDDIQDLGGTIHLPIEHGAVDISGMSHGKRYFLWLDIPNHVCSWRFAKRDELVSDAVWDAVSAERVEVTLLDPSGLPMAGIDIRAFNSVDGIDYVGLPCDAKLPRKFYLRISRTNEYGVAVFSEPLAEPMTVSAVPLHGLSVPAASTVVIGDHVTLRAVRAIEVYGSLKCRDGEPIGHGYVGFLIQGERGTEDAGITAVAEDGSYTCASVRADASCVAAVAISDGYSPLQRLISRPDLLGRVRLDFVMDKSCSRVLQLIMPDGTPVGGIRAMLSTNGYDWLPGSYTTDENGRFTTPAYLVPGNAYVLKWWLGRWQGPDASFEVKEGDAGSVVVELPQLGRIGRIEVAGRSDGESLSASFVSALTPDSAGINWSNLSQPSPLLPSGPGYLAIASSTGHVASVTVVVVPGTENNVVVDIASGALTFALPQGEDGHRWDITVTDEAGRRCGVGSFLPGVAQMELPVGVYCLAVHTDTPRGFSVGPFSLTALGLDLGEVRPSGTSILGMVFDEAGRPWSGMSVELTRDDGWYAGRVKSSADGAFAFRDLAPGYYTARASTNESSLLFHPDVATVVELDSSGDKVIGFCIPVEDQSEVELRGPADRPVIGLHVSERELEVAPIDGHGRFLVSVPTKSDWIGALHTSVGRVWLCGQKVAAPERAYAIDGAGNRDLNIRLLGPMGAPLASARVDLRVRERLMLPTSAATGADGSLSCSVPPEMPLELLVHVPSGDVVPMSVSGLPGAGAITIGAERLAVEVVCRSLAGEPIPGVTVWAVRERTRRITNAHGSVCLPGVAPRASLRMEKDGYWPTVVSVQPALDVVLRRPVEEVLLRLPEGMPVSVVSVTPTFTVGQDLLINPTWSDEVGCWRVGPIPEGDYRVAALDREGTQVMAEDVRVTASGSREIRVR